MKTNLFLKCVSVLTVVMFLSTSAAWSAPKDTLAAREKTKEDPESILGAMETADVLNVVSPMIVEAYKAFRDGDTAKSAAITDDIKTAIAGAKKPDGTPVDFRPDIVYKDNDVIDFIETPEIDLISVHLTWNKRDFYLFIRAADKDVETKWEEIEKEGKVTLERDIKFTIANTPYVVSLNNIVPGKGLQELLTRMNAKVEEEKIKSPETAKAIADARVGEKTVTPLGTIHKYSKKNLGSVQIMFLVLMTCVTLLLGCMSGKGGGTPVAGPVIEMGKPVALADVQKYMDDYFAKLGAGRETVSEFTDYGEGLVIRLANGYFYTYTKATGDITLSRGASMPLTGAGRPEVVPLGARVPVAVTDALKDKIDAKDVELEVILANPANIEKAVNVDRLILEHPKYKGLTKDEAIDRLITGARDIKSGKTLVGAAKKKVGTVFYKGYDLDNRLLSEADTEAGNVAFAEDMIMNAPPELSALVEFHEIFHFPELIGDPEHKFIYEGDVEKDGPGGAFMQGLRDGLLTERFVNSTAARDLLNLIGDAYDLNAFRNAAVNVNQPSVIYITADPDNIPLLHAAIEKRKNNPNLKIIIAYNNNMKWTADYREKLMKKYRGIVAGFVSKETLDKTAGKDTDERLLNVAKDLTGNQKLTELDIGFIGSTEGMIRDASTGKLIDFTVAKGLKRIPEIQPERKSDADFHDVGALIDAADFEIMLHRILGDKYDPTMSFAQIAALLGGNLGNELLAYVRALKLDENKAAIEEIKKIPPTTTGLTGERFNHLNKERFAATSA